MATSILQTRRMLPTYLILDVVIVLNHTVGFRVYLFSRPTHMFMGYLRVYDT